MSFGDVCWFQLLDNLRMITFHYSIFDADRTADANISKNLASLLSNCLAFSA